jgi:cation transport ATPase
MADDLTKIPDALIIGKRARRISLQNIVFSVLILISLISYAITGLISVAIAVFLHEFSELVAVANGLRAGRFKS